MSPPLVNGLLILHGNRLEELAEAVFEFLARHPLAPLEEELFLTQSHAMAEWLKMTLAERQGISAATRVELPARFVWRAYRAVLGRDAVPRSSPLDKLPLAWRLMALLPRLADQGDLAARGGPAAGFESVAAFLGSGGDGLRRWQLAQQLADLFDQYQVYRSDWLQDWAAGRERVRVDAEGAATRPLADDERWQARLWRALVQALPPEQRRGTRAALHERFVAALREKTAPATPLARAAAAQAAPAEQLTLFGEPPGDARRWPLLPRRVVLFGTTHIPHATLDALAALAGHVQVLIAVPNPCRYDWSEIVDGHELLRAAQRRQRKRPAASPDAGAPPGHPLLAAWGRQARDFVRQLDAFDDVQRTQREFDVPRVDLFDDDEAFTAAGTLLERVQLAIRDLVPLAEHPGGGVDAADRSIVFHVAHGAQREVEVLHDQLLHLLALTPPAGRRPLAPRDIVVMVPDIEVFAPAIRAVFGQHARGDARFIPYGIADRRARHVHPLLVALRELLHAGAERFAATQLRDLLHLRAVAARLGVPAEDVDLLLDWAEGSGIRWGLDAEQRNALGFAACGEANTWRFGLRRMLMGYATGELDEGFAGIAPYAEVAGLEAGLVGALAELLQRLEDWWRDARGVRSPQAWAARLRALMASLFAATDDEERALLAALDAALATWLQACEEAAFDEPVELAVVREAWFTALEEPGAAQRFKAGGVTFCTLLPLRSIPFEVVCLLGMNDGEYPRRGLRHDFDLMARPGLARAGDRSRRDDDRQLMLDALLAARRVLYVSWAGRSQRNNQRQPPSVVVSQLRDYLERGFGAGVLAPITTEHPLQPFSRRYFSPPAAAPAPAVCGDALFTYAREWRTAHLAVPSATAPPAVAQEEPRLVLTIDELARFMKNPVRAWFQRRLAVRFDDAELAAEDDEPFSPVGLERWRWIDEMLQGLQARARAAPGESAAAAEARLHEQLNAQLERRVGLLARAGRLPLAGPGRQQQELLLTTLEPMLRAWLERRAGWPEELPALDCRVEAANDLLLEDRVGGLRTAALPGAGQAGGECRRIVLRADRLLDGADADDNKARRDKRTLRADKVHGAWLASLAGACAGVTLHTFVIGSDAVVQIAPPLAEHAQAMLRDLLLAWRAAVLGTRPWPSAMRTGLAALSDGARPRDVYEGSAQQRGEGADPYLARLFPDFAALAADAAAFERATLALYGAYADALQRQQVSWQPLPGAPARAAAPAEETAP